MAESWAKWHALMAGGDPEESHKATVKMIFFSFIKNYVHNIINLKQLRGGIL